MKNNESSNVLPHIMLIEDREISRVTTAQLLTEMGCIIIAARDLNEALREYLSHPNIDLVFTDIDLTGASYERDKSGVQIARFIKHIDKDLPVIGYSSKFGDDELSEEDKSFFDGWYSKGSLSIQPLMEMYTSLKSQAIAYNKIKLQRLKPASVEITQREGRTEIALTDIINVIKHSENETIVRIFQEFKNFALQEGKYDLKNPHVDQIAQMHDINRRLYLAEYKVESIKGEVDKSDNSNKVHDLDMRMGKIETLLSSIESKMELQATKIFWYYIISFIGILGGIAGIITLIIKLSGS